MQAKGIHFLVGYTDDVKDIEKANTDIQKVSFIENFKGYEFPNHRNMSMITL